MIRMSIHLFALALVAASVAPAAPVAGGDRTKTFSVGK